MNDKHERYSKTFFSFAIVSTVCLALAVLSGALIQVNERFRLLPSYIFFFSFAAFSVMWLQSILTRDPENVEQIDLRQQRGVLVAAIVVSLLCVISELTLIPWLKIPAGLLLAGAVLLHGYHIWRGFTWRDIWFHVARRFFITDMFFLLVAAVGLFALGWKETWPNTPLVPDFLRPSTVFPRRFVSAHVDVYRLPVPLCPLPNGGLSPREERIFDLWYYVLVGGVLLFLIVILLDLRWFMQTMAVILACGVFIVNTLFAGRLARRLRSIGLIFAFTGLAGLLATSTAGNCLIASNIPTIRPGKTRSYSPTSTWRNWSGFASRSGASNTLSGP